MIDYMTKLLLTYLIICSTITLLCYYVQYLAYEISFDYITCGEAIFRANGSAAPRDSKELAMFNDCVFNGTKRWDK